eukprot:1195636-Prorocentrum_minimum.AAC.9
MRKYPPGSTDPHTSGSWSCLFTRMRKYPPGSADTRTSRSWSCLFTRMRKYPPGSNHSRRLESPLSISVISSAREALPPSRAAPTLSSGFGSLSSNFGSLSSDFWSLWPAPALPAPSATCEACDALSTRRLPLKGKHRAHAAE